MQKALKLGPQPPGKKVAQQLSQLGPLVPPQHVPGMRHSDAAGQTPLQQRRPAPAEPQGVPLAAPVQGSGGGAA